MIREGDKYYANLCHINWHLLSLRDQKSISLLMVFAINPKVITMGLKVLNVESFLEVRLHAYEARAADSNLRKFPICTDLPSHLFVSHGIVKIDISLSLNEIGIEGPNINGKYVTCN